jgi:hypothetical protein
MKHGNMCPKGISPQVWKTIKAARAYATENGVYPNAKELSAYMGLKYTTVYNRMRSAQRAGYEMGVKPATWQSPRFVALWLN